MWLFCTLRLWYLLDRRDVYSCLRLSRRKLKGGSSARTDVQCTAYPPDCSLTFSCQCFWGSDRTVTAYRNWACGASIFQHVRSCHPPLTRYIASSSILYLIDFNSHRSRCSAVFCPTGQRRPPFLIGTDNRSGTGFCKLRPQLSGIRKAGTA